MHTEIDALIRRADQADDGAVDELFSLLYGELHRLAEHALRRGGGAITLGPTTLLHEAYLNIAGREGVAFADRGRFLAYASRAMRGLLIDYARRRRAKKRGRQLVEITLDAEKPTLLQPTPAQTAEELHRLGDALNELAALEPGARRGRGPALLLRVLVRRDRRRCATSRSARCSATGARPGCCCTRA